MMTKRFWSILLAFSALTVNAQTSMHVFTKSGGHSIFNVATTDSIVFIDEQFGAAGDGTLESPFNVAGILKAAYQLTPLPEEQDIEETMVLRNVYVKGYVVRTSTSNNNRQMSYYLSDDKNITNRFYVYSGYYIDGTLFNTGNWLQEGDEVIVCGDLINYKGTSPQFIKGSIIYSVNGRTDASIPGGIGDGSLENPFNAIAAINFGNKLNVGETADNYMYIKGIVSQVNQVFSATYGNASFYISEDGTNENALYCYRILYLGNKRFAEGNEAIKEGDAVIVCAKLTNYNGLIETAQGEGYLYSLNGKTESSSDNATLSIDFKAGIGNWTITDKNKPAEISAIWVHDTRYGMKATAYSNATNYDSESWLISPAFDLTGYTTATLKLRHAINFFASVDKAKEEVAVMASTDGTNWTELTLSSWPSSLGWTFVDTTADMSAFAGESNVQIAFRYTSTAAKAGTWEVEKVSIE